MSNSKKSFLIVIVFALLLTFEFKSFAQEIGEIFTDGRNVEMVFVPEGYLTLGVSRNQLESVCEQLGEEDKNRCVEIVHEETGISSTPQIFVDAFWIDRYEVTIQQFQEYCENVHNTALSNCVELEGNLSDDSSQPQVNVSWYVASAYCNYRGGRLPTEIEWEYAASGTEDLNYPWGNTFTPESVGSTQYTNTYPVGSIESNRSWIGAYDMSGNVAEWVENYYYIYGGHLVEPPPGTIGENSIFNYLESGRVVRGGSWEGRLWPLTTFWRESAPPESASEFIGFRCARTYV